jgi:hypothetical protein
MSFLRGPLNQRASVVATNVRHNTSGNMSLYVAQQLPTGYTGIIRMSRTMNRDTARLTPVFAEIMQDYSLRSKIIIDAQNGACGDSCTLSVKVPIMSHVPVHLGQSLT